MTTAIIDGALFAAHQAGALGDDIGTLSEWRDALLAVRAQALEDAARLIDETWHRTPAEYAAAIRALI